VSFSSTSILFPPRRVAKNFPFSFRPPRVFSQRTFTPLPMLFFFWNVVRAQRPPFPDRRPPRAAEFLPLALFFSLPSSFWSAEIRGQRTPTLYVSRYFPRHIPASNGGNRRCFPQKNSLLKGRTPYRAPDWCGVGLAFSTKRRPFSLPPTRRTSF